MTLLKVGILFIKLSAVFQRNCCSSLWPSNSSVFVPSAHYPPSLSRCHFVILAVSVLNIHCIIPQLERTLSLLIEVLLCSTNKLLWLILDSDVFDLRQHVLKSGRVIEGVLHVRGQPLVASPPDSGFTFRNDFEFILIIFSVNDIR